MYFLPDYTLESDTLGQDLNNWVFGSSFRSEVKNQFEDLELHTFTVEEVPDVYPL